MDERMLTFGSSGSQKATGAELRVLQEPAAVPWPSAEFQAEHWTCNGLRREHALAASFKVPAE